MTLHTLHLHSRHHITSHHITVVKIPATWTKIHQQVAYHKNNSFVSPNML